MVAAGKTRGRCAPARQATKLLLLVDVLLVNLLLVVVVLLLSLTVQQNDARKSRKLIPKQLMIELQN